MHKNIHSLIMSVLQDVLYYNSFEISVMRCRLYFNPNIKLALSGVKQNLKPNIHIMICISEINTYERMKTSGMHIVSMYLCWFVSYLLFVNSNKMEIQLRLDNMVHHLGQQRQKEKQQKVIRGKTDVKKWNPRAHCWWRWRFGRVTDHTVPMESRCPAHGLSQRK